jgi:tRNA threonylcarbamoyladenosine biosynthesis protein TsaB
MQIVAIETSGRHGSLAALIGGANEARLVRQVTLSGEQRTAQSLAPSLRDLLAEVNWIPQTVELVAVAVGPGSFTGLRIGVTTAKTFAYAVGAQIVGVNTLEVLAEQVPISPAPLWTIMDAQRQELFVARFAAEHEGGRSTELNPCIAPREVWLAELLHGDRVTGPALQRLASRLPDGAVAVSDELWQPTAAAVGRLAWQAYRRGQRDDFWKLAPVYYRPSAAEEKADRRAVPRQF